MKLERVLVSGFRNLERIVIEPSEGASWIVGGNGAGKTSLLEAIYLLFRGKSFRGRKHGELLQRGCQELRVGGTVRVGEVRHKIDVRRNRAGSAVFANGGRIDGVRALFPGAGVRMIGENAQKLLEGGPELRRWFLDWNVFHVEPEAVSSARECKRILLQRNAWLREGARGKPVWDELLERSAMGVTQARARYIQRLQQCLDAGNSAGEPESGIEIRFSRGWPDNEGLVETLERSLTADRNRGYTYYGPARADFSLVTDGRSGLVSRGQIKEQVIQVQVAADRVQKEMLGEGAIWLLDDFPADLDRRRSVALWALIGGTGGQIFATAVDERPEYLRSSGEILFHVEQGALV